MTKIYAILDTQGNLFVDVGSNNPAYHNEGTAKAAFSRYMGWKRPYGWAYKPIFDSQERYKVVELTEVFYRLEGLDK